MVWGAIGSIAGAVIGSKLSRSNQKASSERANQQQLANNSLTYEQNLDLWDKNANLQREFAQKGIQWRTQDAKAAGLHPLSVLGVSPTSASPTVFQNDPAQSYTGGPGWSQDYSGIGRDVGNAMGKLLVEKSEADVEKTRLEAERLKNDVLIQRGQIHDQNQRARSAEQLDNLTIKEKEAIIAEIQERKGKGSRSNPKPLGIYYRDPYSGRIVVAPNEEYTEGFENIVGKGMGTYLQGSETKRNQK